MTLDEIKNYDREYLTPKQVAPLLHMMPYSINLQAKCRPETLPFPVVWSGFKKPHLKIPRLAFIAVFDPHYREDVAKAL